MTTPLRFKKDFLQLQLRDMPYFRAVLRAVECKFYQPYRLESPTLDLGCGDGHFVTMAFDQQVDVGVDPWSGPVREACRRGGYKMVNQGYGDALPYPDAYFGSAISNSVLEHILSLDPVLAELARVLKPGALFLFCVPNQNFLANLSISTFLDRIGLKQLGNAYRSFFNRISRHHHCDAPEVWAERLSRAGFKIEKWWHYFSPRATHILEWGHYFGLPSLISFKLFKRWVLIQSDWGLAIPRWITLPAYTEPEEQPRGSYTFYVVRRA